VKALSLYEYAAHCLDDRFDILLAHGTFITLVNGPKRAYGLYALFGFYVEVELNHHEVVTAVVAFKHAEKLNKYLPQVDLSDLFLNA
jgi:hypothetical protein